MARFEYAGTPRAAIAIESSGVFNCVMVEFNVSGSKLRLRPIAPDDAPKLVAGLEALSDEARVGRFFFTKTAFSRAELDALTHCDGINHSGFVIVTADDAAAPLIAVGRWIRDSVEPSLATVAFVTRDDWQRRGLGALLVAHLARDAREKGIERFRAEVLWGNAAAVKLLNTLGVQQRRQPLGAGATEFIYTLK